MRFPKTKHAILGVVVILAAVAGVFAVQLFTQTFPSITRHNPPPTIQINCATLVADNSTIPLLTTSGYVLFNCGPSTSAFKMVANATLTPNFTLPAGYVSLWATMSNCNATLLSLQSGTPITLTLGNYNYCALTDASTAGLGTFSVTWVSGPKDNTSLSISCPNHVVIGTPGVCTVKVTDTTNSTFIPTGTVTFNSSDTSQGTVGSSCTLNGSGTCSVSISGVLDGGTFNVTGVYAGDPGHNGSSSKSGNIFSYASCSGICT